MGGAIASFLLTWYVCIQTLDKHHELGERATQADYIHGVAGIAANRKGGNKLRRMLKS